MIYKKCYQNWLSRWEVMRGTEKHTLVYYYTEFLELNEESRLSMKGWFICNS